MGCDGGTIPRRDELVRTKKKPEQKDKAAELSFRWHCCSISQNPLEEPVVACGLGRLYSKVSILENLLDKTKMPEVSKHVKSLKDVKDLHLTPNPAYKECPVEEGGASRSSPYICPVIGLEMSGRFRFVFLWSCGCVFSERALKEIKSSICHKCQKPFSDDDVVVINPNEDDMERAVARMEARKAKQMAEKGKKKKLSPTPEECSDGPERKVPKIEKPATAVKAGPSGSTSTGSQSKGLVDPQMKKASIDYSVSKDPKASTVYKSLFTTSDKASRQTKAHWITYNPYFN